MPRRQSEDCGKAEGSDYPPVPYEESDASTSGRFACTDSRVDGLHRICRFTAAHGSRVSHDAAC